MKIIHYILLFHFSIGALLPKCDFDQFAKLDDLMRHYALHQQDAKQKNQTISFWDFLYLHFFSGEPHEHDDSDDHEHLPLKAISSNTILFSYTKSAVCTKTSTPNHATPALFDSCFLDIDFVHTIFRPPIASMI